MTHSPLPPPDPKLDLVLEREVDVPPSLVWAAWTTPEHICKWFAPAPWSVVRCRIDLRPGGEFMTEMQSPEGESMGESAGCYLEVIPERRLIWTSTLLPGYRPSLDSFLPFTASISMTPSETGTHYTAVAMHGDEDGRQRHAEMGFEKGWGKALEQMVALAKTL